MSQQATSSAEKIDLHGGHLVEKIRELVHEGNVRRIFIKDPDGHSVMELPVTVGVAGVLAAPKMAAVGALAAIAADYSVEVEREQSGTANPAVTALESDGHTPGRRLLERYVDLYNAHDLDGCMELYAQDAVQHMPDGTFEGRSKVKERLARELAAFPDIQFGFSTFVEQGDTFADEWTFVGTHTGSLTMPDGNELPPTGKRVEIKGMEFVQLRDGKIVIDNLYYDNVAVLTQLGLVPQGVPAVAG